MTKPQVKQDRSYAIGHGSGDAADGQRGVQQSAANARKRAQKPAADADTEARMAEVLQAAKAHSVARMIEDRRWERSFAVTATGHVVIVLSAVANVDEDERAALVRKLRALGFEDVGIAGERGRVSSDKV